MSIKLCLKIDFNNFTKEGTRTNKLLKRVVKEEIKVKTRGKLNFFWFCDFSGGHIKIFGKILENFPWIFLFLYNL